MIARLVCSGPLRTERPSLLRRHEDCSCSGSLPGLNCSTDTLHVTQTGLRVRIEPDVEKWETCNKEIDLPSEWSQHNSSKFSPSQAHKKGASVGTD